MSRLRTAASRTGRLLQRAIGEFFEDGCPQRAAAISYYALLSLFPMAILTVAGIGLFLDDQRARDRVVETVLEQLPLREDAGAADIESLLREITSQGAAFSAVGAFTLLLAASGVIGAIRHALNAAWDVGDPRPPLQGKALDVLLVMGLGLLVLASLASTVALRLSDEVTDVLGGTGDLIDTVIRDAAALLPALLAAITFAVLFAVMPARRPSLRDIWPGVLLATVGYELSKAGFTLYLESFARYGTIYASLGTAVAFMVFVFVAANVMLLGAEAAAEWPAVRDGRIDDDEPDAPLGTRVKRKLKSLVVSQDAAPTPADEALAEDRDRERAARERRSEVSA